jgi:hypothetical protein
MGLLLVKENYVGPGGGGALAGRVAQSLSREFMVAILFLCGLREGRDPAETGPLGGLRVGGCANPLTLAPILG